MKYERFMETSLHAPAVCVLGGADDALKNNLDHFARLVFCAPSVGGSRPAA